MLSITHKHEQIDEELVAMMYGFVENVVNGGIQARLADSLWQDFTHDGVDFVFACLEWAVQDVVRKDYNV